MPSPRRTSLKLNNAGDPASQPINLANREIFAQAVAAGENVQTAYENAGYKGAPISRRALRKARDVDARIKWLLRERIEADATERKALAIQEIDARSRLIRELESVAYVDIGELVAWDRTPQFDKEGGLAGYADVIELTPSRLLTRHQRAAVKSVTSVRTKSGETIKLDLNGKLEAIAQLARILGMVAPDGPSTVNNTQVNVGQVNVAGEQTALEAARRLAFALEKAARLPKMIEVEATTRPPHAGDKPES